MTDLTKLKELAELASKATPGPWWIDSHGHCMVSESQDHRIIFLTNDGMGPATRHPETGNLSHWPNDWDASYIASADPTTILALIAEVERLRKHTEKAQGHALKMGNHALQGIEDAARLEGEVDRLKADNAALRKDAERYRWLRVQPNDCTAPRIDVVRWEPIDESANEGEGLRFEALDAAIDAAMEGGGNG